MTPPPDEKPLSRRELREQQRQTPGSRSESRRASAPATTGGEIPEVAPTPVEDAAKRPEQPPVSSEPDEGQPEARPLTRREARLRRTAAVDVIPTTPSPAVPEEDAGAPEVEPVRPESPIPSAQRAAAPGGDAPERVNAQERVNAPEPSSASARDETPEPGLVKPHPTGSDRDETVIAIAAEGIDGSAPANGAADTADAEGKHPLASAFGKAVEEQKERPSADLHDAPFDQIIARGIESASSSNSLILPSMPAPGQLTGPITGSGDVIITGSIELPEGLGSTGQHPQHFDKSDIDAMFESDEDQVPSTAGTPVSASKAVSTHTATRDVINPPAPAKNNRLLMALAITAGVLAVAVLAVVIVAFATGALGG